MPTLSELDRICNIARENHEALEAMMALPTFTDLPLHLQEMITQTRYLSFRHYLDTISAIIQLSKSDH